MTDFIRRDALPEGSELHAYRIDRVLGSGAFGITYLAVHTMLLTRHVIKEYLPDNALREDGYTVHPKSSHDLELFNWGLNSFFEEARLLSRLDHPGIVKVTDLFKANGTAYFVMPFLEGVTLHTWIEENPAASRVKLEELFVPLLDGLAYLHEQSLLHRDIKPENIYVTNSGKPVLIDFGSARLLIGMKSRAVTQLLTPHFAPFEQYAAKGNFTPALDLYSLAGCLYQAVTRELPVEAPARVQSDTQLRLSESAHAQTYGREFLAAVDRAMAIMPADRFQSATDFKKSLLEGWMPDSPCSQAPGEPLQNGPAGHTQPGAEVPRTTLLENDAPEEPVKTTAEGNRKPSGSVAGSPATNPVLSRRKALVAAAAVCLAAIAGGAGYFFVANQGAVAALEPADVARTGDVWKSPEAAPAQRERLIRLTEQGNAAAGVLLEKLALDPALRPTAESSEWASKNSASGLAKALPRLDSGEARALLGMAHDLGLCGLAASPESAAPLMRQAAEQGFAPAQNYLGHLYELGRGVPQSAAEALAWYAKAAEQGDPRGLTNLGFLYERGKIAEAGPEQARECYLKAAQQGFAPAQASLAFLYEQGIGGRSNEAEALAWYRKAAGQGNTDALCALGKMYEEGRAGLRRDPGKAASFYRQAAELGHARAQSSLALMYETGQTGEVDRKQADYWYGKAAASQADRTRFGSAGI